MKKPTSKRQKETEYTEDISKNYIDSYNKYVEKPSTIDTSSQKPLTKTSQENGSKSQEKPSVLPQITPIKQPIETVKNIPSPTPSFTFGPNTHEIKTVKIDFDRVANIELVEGEHNGYQTFGIKFYFMGNKGLYRIIWFGRNLFDRDRVYAIEYKFWRSLAQGGQHGAI